MKICVRLFEIRREQIQRWHCMQRSPISFSSCYLSAHSIKRAHSIPNNTFVYRTEHTKSYLIFHAGNFFFILFVQQSLLGIPSDNFFFLSMTPHDWFATVLFHGLVAHRFGFFWTLCQKQIITFLRFFLWLFVHLSPYTFVPFHLTSLWMVFLHILFVIPICEMIYIFPFHNFSDVWAFDK